MVKYRVKPISPEAHLFGIELTIGQPDPDGQLLKFPAWIPGSYMIRDFARHIVSIHAYRDGQSVKLSKLDKQTWCCEAGRGELLIEYEVYAWDLSVRGAHLDTTHGYFNGTSLFFRVVGQDHLPCNVSILVPDGEEYKSWKIATTLPATTNEMRPDGYSASGYEELIDHPVEMGCFGIESFDVSGTRHRLVITGSHFGDVQRLCSDLKRICAAQQKMFAGFPKMNSYLFLLTLIEDGYGGLEHRTSCSLIASRGDMPKLDDKTVTDGYRRLLGLCSHEYFHLWNVKRIQPACFQNSGLDKEVYTPLLWAFEGITSYYDDLMLVRSGCIEPESYLELLAQNITRYIRGKGRFKQSIEESSYDAWTKFYQQDENAPNAIVSYYTKGALVALLLDLKIRHATGDIKSLDDVMRVLWREFGESGKGVDEGDVEKVVEYTIGGEMSDFFTLALRSTDELPLAKWLATVGIGMELTASTGEKDRGGIYKKTEQKETRERVDTGMEYDLRLDGVHVKTVFDAGAAQEAGIAAGDHLIAIDNLRIPPVGPDKIFQQFDVGREVGVHLFRYGVLMERKLTLKNAPSDTCRLWFCESTIPTLARRDNWLGVGDKVSR